MFRALWRGWRVIATGLSFAFFGLGGLLLLVIGLPLMYLLFPRAERRQRMARKLVRWLFWLFIHYMWITGVLRFRFINAERLSRPGLVIVANHPTLLDVVFLISAVPDATCIVRGGLARNPFTRAPVALTGYVCNDSGVELVDASVKAVRAGSSLVVFPEGTRSNPARPPKWQRGAANIALQAGVSLTPVCITCDPPTLRKGEPWWQVPPRRMRYCIEVLDDLPVTDWSPQREHETNAARYLTERLKDLLTGRVERNARA
jgi:1-acyl-sn-glycerol-3-phosphate acyltransferase